MRCTHKAVHTQGATHKRRSVATAGVLLFKGPQARRCTHKAVQPKGGLPTQGSGWGGGRGLLGKRGGDGGLVVGGGGQVGVAT